MLTITTIGDDAWETDEHLIDALTGWHVEVASQPGRVWEVRGAHRGGVLLWPVGPDGTTSDTEDSQWFDADQITLRVL